MATIDRLLEAAVRHRVETVILEPGRRPRLRREGHEHEVTDRPLDATTIERLLAEIAPGQRVPDPVGEPRWAFDYTLGRTTFHFVGLASPAGWRFTAAILPAAEVERTPSSPPPPPQQQPTRRPLPSLENLLRSMVELGASDLHLSAWQTPWLRIHGELAALETFEAPTSAALKERLLEVTPPRVRDHFEQSGNSGFVHPMEDLGAFRIRLFRDYRGVGAAIRYLPRPPYTAEQLELPASLLAWTASKRGLILLAGPQSSGRTSTLMALLHHLAEEHPRHIVTLERSVEYELPISRSLIRQREVPPGDQSLREVLSGLRELDVEVVALADLDEPEIPEVALDLAASGRLVFLLLEAAHASGALEKLLARSRSARDETRAERLADCFAGLAVQKLMRRIQGAGRLAVWELVPPIPAVTSCIRERQLWKLPAIVSAAHEAGASCETEALADLVAFQLVSAAEALRVAWDPQGLRERLEARGLLPGDSSRVGPR